MTSTINSFNPLPLAGRILLALVFVLAGYSKLTGGIDPTVAAMSSHGIPYPSVLVYGVIAVELVGGLMLMAGFYTRWVALALFCYTLALAIIFHAYWAVPPEAAGMQRILFYEHISMMGGMLFMAAFGAGPLSVDQLRARGLAAREAGYPAGGHPAE